VQYTELRTVDPGETLEYGKYYLVKTEANNLLGEGFARWTSQDWRDFRAKLQYEMSQNDLLLVGIEKIDDHRAGIITRYEGHSILAISIVAVIGIALSVFGLWIVNDEIVEILREGKPIAFAGVLIVLAIIGFMIFAKLK